MGHPSTQDALSAGIFTLNHVFFSSKCITRAALAEGGLLGSTVRGRDAWNNFFPSWVSYSLAARGTQVYYCVLAIPLVPWDPLGSEGGVDI